MDRLGMKPVMQFFWILMMSMVQKFPNAAVVVAEALADDGSTLSIAAVCLQHGFKVLDVDVWERFDEAAHRCLRGEVGGQKVWRKAELELFCGRRCHRFRRSPNPRSLA